MHTSLLNSLPDRFNEQVADIWDTSAHYDHIGVENVNKASNSDTNLFACPDQDLLWDQVAFACQVNDILRANTIQFFDV